MQVEIDEPYIDSLKFADLGDWYYFVYESGQPHGVYLKIAPDKCVRFRYESAVNTDPICDGKTLFAINPNTHIVRVRINGIRATKCDRDFGEP